MALSLAQIILPAPNDLPSPSLQRVTVHDKPYLVRSFAYRFCRLAVDLTVRHPMLDIPVR